MTNSVTWFYRCSRFGFAAAVLALFSGCGSEPTNLSTEPTTDALAGDSLPAVPADSTLVPGDSTAVPVDSTAIPVDSTAVPSDSTLGFPDSLPPVDTSGISTLTTSTHPGIPFGNYNMLSKYLTTVYNGTMQGLEPSWLMAELVTARAKGGRLILKLVGGSDDRQKNADGTFSFTKWKTLVDKFKTLNLSSYINDGTLMGVFLIDEPHNTSKWGGKAIPHATVEAMAKHTKLIWPTLPTFARARPTWLAQTSITYNYLDAGWFQFEAPYMGDISAATAKEISAAKAKRLGIAVGLNVLNGGNGSSGLRGSLSGKYKMSATEIRNYGTVLLNQPYACGFFNWTYILGGAEYMARTDIKSAMTFLSTKAKAHVKTSCRQ
jgi:hypothetical protein